LACVSCAYLETFYIIYTCSIEAKTISSLNNARDYHGYDSDCLISLPYAGNCLEWTGTHDHEEDDDNLSITRSYHSLKYIKYRVIIYT